MHTYIHTYMHIIHLRVVILEHMYDLACCFERPTVGSPCTPPFRPLFPFFLKTSIHVFRSVP